MTPRAVKVVSAGAPFRATRADLLRRWAPCDGLAALVGGGPTPEGRYSVFCHRPEAEFVVAAGAPPAAPPRGVWGGKAAAPPDVFDQLREFATRYRVASEGASTGPFAGGVLAVLAFDLRRHVEVLPDRSPVEPAVPDLLARRFAAWAVHDGVDERVEIFRWEDPSDPELTARAQDAAAELAARAAADAAPPHDDGAAPRRVPEGSDPPFRYREKIGAAIEAIRRGDVYQLNLAQRFRGPAPRDVGAFLARLATEHPAPLGGVVRLGADAWLVSASPERFLRVRGREVVTRPIKGTAPRGAGPEEDARRRLELAASPKERAELAMIVDLLRNDLSATATPGSVVVREPFSLETHPTVHHLAATVAATLAPDRDAFDLVRAAWPGGSISGCPKIRALELIDAWEEFRRGAYTGSLASFSADGRVDLNLLIRSTTLVDGVASLWGGGGITIASEPEAERRETLHKIRGLARALGWEPPS